MSTPDLIWLGGVAASVGLGVWRGVVYEVLSVVGWGAAFVAAQWWGGWAVPYLPVQGFSEPLRYAAGFAAVFVAVAFGSGWLAWVLSRLLAFAGLRPVDRMFGAVFGLLRALVLSLALALVVNMTPLRQHAWWQSSGVAPYLDTGLRQIKDMAPPAWAPYFP